MRIPIQPVALPRPMRQHPVFGGPAHLRRRFRSVRVLERRFGLHRQNRTETIGPHLGRKQHEILFGRIEQHFPRLFRQSDTNRTGNVLHGIGDFRRGRTELFWPGGHE